MAKPLFDSLRVQQPDDCRVFAQRIEWSTRDRRTARPDLAGPQASPATSSSTSCARQSPLTASTLHFTYVSASPRRAKCGAQFEWRSQIRKRHGRLSSHSADQPAAASSARAGALVCQELGRAPACARCYFRFCRRAQTMPAERAIFSFLQTVSLAPGAIVCGPSFASVYQPADGLEAPMMGQHQGGVHLAACACRRQVGGRGR